MSSPTTTRPEPARLTWRSRSRSAPASPANASCSAPRPSGSRLGEAQRRDKLEEELDRLSIPLLICDEVGYIPFDPQAASLMFMLVSNRYERASMIVTSNKPFPHGERSSVTTWPPPR